MTDIEISRNSNKLNITDIGKKIGLKKNDLELYGNYKAKITNISSRKKQGKLILVTAISPTPMGEGKTTVSIGLGDALNRLGKKIIIALREPSMGPVFGMKGGATGGGYSQVVPMEDINLHFTGDFHAITSANNLISAAIDNHIYFGNKLDIQKVLFKRCLDVNDRALRDVDLGTRHDSFTITSASEVMALFCLATSLDDLRAKLGNIIVGTNSKGEYIYVRDLGLEGSLVALLKDALNPESGYINDQIKQLQSEIDSAKDSKSEYEAAVAEIEELKSQKADLESQQDTKNDEIDEKQDQINNTQANIDALDNASVVLEKASLEAQLELLIEEQNRLSFNLQAYQMNGDNADEINEQYTVITEKIGILRSDIEKLDPALKEIEDQKAFFETQKADQEWEKSVFEEELETITKDLEKITKEAVEIAEKLRLSEKIISVTILAIGTSLPELVTSVSAAYKGKSDIAIGNILGSNIFNMLLIIGVSSIINPIAYNTSYNIDMVFFVVGMLLLALFPVIPPKNKMTRWNGILYLYMYVAYMVSLFIR